MNYHKNMSFCDRLRELRLQEGLYQKDIAKLLNVKVATVSAWEKGINEPDIATIKRLADYYHVTTDYLLDYTAYDYNFEYRHNGTVLKHKEARNKNENRNNS